MKRIKKSSESSYNIKNTISFIYSIDKKIFILSLIRALVSGISPFINTIMIPLILKNLMEKAPYNKLISLVILMTILNALAWVIAKGLNYLDTLRMSVFENNYRKMKTNKFFTVNYENLEKSEFEDLRQNIRFSDESMGSIRALVNQFYNLFTHIFSIITGTIIVEGLISKILNQRANINIYSILGIILLIVSVVGLTKLTMKMQKKCEKTLPTLYEDITKSNRLGMYLADYVVYHYNIGKDIRLYDASNMISSEEKNMTDAIEPALKKVSRLSILPGTMGNVSSVLVGGLIYILVGTYAWAGYVSIDEVILYSGSIQQLIGSITQFIFVFGELAIINARLGASFRLLNMPSSEETVESDNNIDIEGNFEIKFDDVSFKYPDSKKWALKNVSFTIDSKEKIAIVGTNGAGKSTAIKLICRLYEPTEGYIFMNGHNIQNINKRKYQQILSVVFQDFKLFAFSLGENLSLDEKYNKKLGEEVLNKVGFGERLKTLSKGVDTSLYHDYAEDGIELSGGEAQKIAIARSLYFNTPIVILDEPTSALDPIAEADIYDNLNKIIYDKTGIFVSHRLSACKFCNKILVFDKGKKVQEGSHNELLLQHDGLYQTLWEAQAQYYQ